RRSDGDSLFSSSSDLSGADFSPTRLTFLGSACFSGGFGSSVSRGAVAASRAPRASDCGLAPEPPGCPAAGPGTGWAALAPAAEDAARPPRAGAAADDDLHDDFVLALAEADPEPVLRRVPAAPHDHLDVRGVGAGGFVVLGLVLVCVRPSLAAGWLGVILLRG